MQLGIKLWKQYSHVSPYGLPKALSYKIHLGNKKCLLRSGKNTTDLKSNFLLMIFNGKSTDFITHVLDGIWRNEESKYFGKIIAKSEKKITQCLERPENHFASHLQCNPHGGFLNNRGATNIHIFNQTLKIPLLSHSHFITNTPFKCGAREDSWHSLEQQRDQTGQF